MGRAGPVVSVRGVGRKNSRERERWRGVVRREAEGNKEIPDKETDHKIKQSLPLLLPRPNVTLFLKAEGC